MSLRKRLLIKSAEAALVPSEHFGTMIWEGDGSSTRSVNGGKFGAAGYFNGSSSYISTGINLSSLPAYSYSFWFKQTPSTPNSRIFGGANGTGTHTGMFRVRTDINVINYYSINYTTYTWSQALTDNVWSYLTLTDDGTNVKLYLNGTEVTSPSTGSYTTDDNTNLQIGRGMLNSGSIGNYTEGLIDQVRIFQKALSSSEVSTLYSETLATSTSLDPLSEDTTDTLQVLGDSSCIATYRFENNEDDESGNYNGSGTEIQYAAGRYGQAASFNGSSSYVSLSNASTMLGTPTGQTISCWAKFNSVSSSGFNNTVLLAANDGTNPHWQITLYDGKIYGDYFQSSSIYRQRVGSTSISANTWYHFVVTFDSTDSDVVQFYVNGQAETATNQTSGGTFTGNIQNPSLPIRIGRRDLSGGSWYMNGEIDQVRIFNKVLSASEVTTLYNENSLVASYRFEGNANDDTRNYDGTASNVTYEYGLNFTPDFVWAKIRTSNASSHRITDSTRGSQYEIFPNLDLAEIYRSSGYMSSFDQGGFTVGSTTALNGSGSDYVAWCLKANGGTTSSNTDGSITSTVQVNETAGFSIVKWTGTTTTSDTIGHGLSAGPEILMLKNLDSTGDWFVYTTLIDGSYDYLRLNTTGAKSNSGRNAPTSTVFDQTTLGSSISSGDECIAYCFYSVDSFSKIGTYTGNGSTDGPIVETGFEPAFVMIKPTSAVGAWRIVDNKRNLTNPRNSTLKPNESEAELTGANEAVDFLSNGFQIKTSHSGRNTSGVTYFYMAFAADPDTEAPAVAKSFEAITYDGSVTSGTGQTLNFSNDVGLLWVKSRSTNTHNAIFDKIRGAGSKLRSSATTAELDNTYGGIKTFNGNSITFEGTSDTGDVDYTGREYIAWAWKADDNEPTINTEGSIDSLVSANSNAGFSIVKYEGNGSAGATIGHGLSAAPEMVIIKNLDGAYSWAVRHSALDSDKNLFLNSTVAQTSLSTTSHGGVGALTSTTFGFITGASSLNNINASGNNYIAYCFHSVSGYSKFGSYTGNGTAGHSITGLGFQPDFVMIKTTTFSHNWVIADSVRGDQKSLFPNLSNAETDQGGDDLVSLDSNGFTVGTNTRVNSNGQTFIYAAFKIN